MEGYSPRYMLVNFYFVGIKRAAARTPHMMMGNKSNDAIFESLEKEFVSAIVRPPEERLVLTVGRQQLTKSLLNRRIFENRGHVF